MTALAFDIYPASSPVSGARLARLEADDFLDGTEYRRSLRGTGAGRIVIHSEHAAVQAGHLAADNYVRVVDLGYNQILGGFWLMEGQEVVLSRDEQGGEIRSYGGPGTLHYLSRATLPTVARSASAGPNDQFYIDTEGAWVWGSAGSETYGGILRRLLVEALLDVPTAIPDRGALNWTDALDSSGAAWATFTGEYRIRVGTNLLDAVLDLMRKGIDVVMNPDTFAIDAYLVGNYGTDRSSATFATDKVRFVAGTNIAADLAKAIHRLPYVSHLLVVGSDGITYVEVVDPAWVSGNTVYRETLRLDTTTDTTIMAEAGAEAIRDRKLRGNQATFPIRPGATPLSGLYAAGVHFVPGDLVTLHTGTGTHDYNEQAIEVAAITWKQLTDNGEFTPVVDLGSQYIDARTAAELRQMGTIIRQPNGHTHPANPRLCRPALAAATRYSKTLDWAGPSYTETIPESMRFGTGDYSWVGEADAGYDAVAGSEAINLAYEPPVANFAISPGQTVRVRTWFEGNIRFKLQFYTSADVLISEESLFVQNVGSTWTQSAQYERTAPATAAYFRIGPGNGSSGHIDHLEVAALTAASAGGGHADLVGDGEDASRCGHAHHVYRTTAPTTGDDIDDGYPKGTAWYVVDSLTTPTAVSAAYLLLNNAAGAAVWRQYAIPPAIVDAKGDLIVATAADTAVRLAVGTNDQVLTADSTQATGVKWATPAGPTAAQVRDAGRWEPVIYDLGGGDGSVLMDGGSPPDALMDWRTT